MEKLSYKVLSSISECKNLSQLYITINPEWLSESPLLLKLLETTFESLDYLSNLSLSGKK